MTIYFLLQEFATTWGKSNSIKGTFLRLELIGLAYCLKCGKTTESKEFYCAACLRFPDAALEQEMEQASQKKRNALVLLLPVLLVLGLLGLRYFVYAPGETETDAARVLTVCAESGSIQDAIDTAEKGDTIQVEPGIYRENINFKGKEVVLTSTNPDDDDVIASTVIDGGEKGPAVTFEQGEGSGAVLRGFTITGQSGAPVIYEHLYGDRDRGLEGCGGGGILITGDSAPLVEKNVITGIDLLSGPCGSNSVGAGIFIADASPVIVDNAIAGNTAHRGGGIYVFNAQPRLENNFFSGNKAGWDGGGIYVRGAAPTAVENNRLVENTAERGGGIFVYSAAAYIRYNELQDNEARFMGGGLYLEEDSQAIVSGNQFFGNHGGECGGGLAVRTSSPRLASNTFRDNSAGWRGGGAVYMFDRSSPRLINNSWAGNTAEEGAAIWVSSDSSPDLGSEVTDGATNQLKEEELFFQE